MDQAVRANRGRRILPTYLSRVERRLGRRVRPSELVGLADTDAAWAALSDVLENLKTDGPPCAWDYVAIDTGDAAIAQKFLNRAGRVLGEGRRLWLIVQDSEYCGAVPVNVRELVDRALELTGSDEDAVRACDRDADHGFLFYADTVSGHAQLRWTVMAWSRGDGRAVTTSG